MKAILRFHLKTNFINFNCARIERFIVILKGVFFDKINKIGVEVHSTKKLLTKEYNDSTIIYERLMCVQCGKITRSAFKDYIYC